MKTRNRLFRRFSLAVFLSISVGMAWFLAAGFLYSIIDSLSSSNNTYENLFFRNGTPIIQVSKTGVGLVGYRNLDGKPVEVSDRNFQHPSELSKPVDREEHFFHLPWQRRIQETTNYDCPESWFFIYDGNLDGHGYMVGYDNVSKTTVGYLGRNGFHRDKPLPEEQFPIDGQMVSQNGLYRLIHHDFKNVGQYAPKYLLSKDGLVYIDPKSRTVRLVRKDTNLISMATDAAATTLGPNGKPQDSLMTLLRTPDRVLVLDSDNRETRTYPIPAELRNDTFALLPLPNGKALIWRGRFGAKNILFWLDAKGKVTKRQDVTLKMRARMSKTKEAYTVCVAAPSVGIIGGVILCYPWGAARSQLIGYWGALGKAMAVYWLPLLLLGVLSVVLGVLCYRRQRKYGLPGTWLLVGFVMFFGLPAYLGYLAHRRWPARLPCPHCAEPAPRERDACFACHETFPDPAPKGTEIFA